MSSDPVSKKLAMHSPLRDHELIAAIARYEHLTVPELEEAWIRVNEEFRAWVDAPENAGRRFQDAPQYRDRIAIDSLREWRTWAE
ncbi:MAG: hypothetical protein IT200_07595 [Thermoleophilia bacterium]|nr:hypothetical protein [Thermoleophilia bacterium]